MKSLLLPAGSTYVVARYLQRFVPVTTRFMPNPVSAAYILDDKLARSGVVFVGRLVDAKGIRYLIEACSIMSPPTSLTVIGDGPERERLEKLGRELSVEVEFVGSRPPDEVASILRRRSVLCIPSVSNPPEVYPLVALEGLAAGCRVVATDCGGLPEAVGGCGVVVPEGNAAALAAAIVTSLEKGGLSVEEVETRARHLQRHSAGAVLDAYEAALAEAGAK
ncbi:glycosyltransferase [Microbacterium hatanonis]|uniref:glycosyltransferase n=1 Tax=Microbacterium hatanonis TaxID=404366 RepID=UPI00164F16BA|nr:glycosyltransferase [Microbacterium hatanonis]